MSSQTVVSGSNQGPLANEITWLCLAASGCLIVAKITTKIWKLRRIQGDDIYALTALALNIAAAIVTSLQVRSGLGQHVSMLSQRQIVSFEKSTYALDFLFVASMATAKMVILHFLYSIVFDHIRRALLTAAVGVNLTLALTSIFVVAFKCRPPQTWSLSNTACIDLTVFWAFYTAVDTLMDVVLVLLPAYIVACIQIPLRQKLIFDLVFSGSLCVIPCVVVRVIYIGRSNWMSDLTWNALVPVVMTQVSMNVALLGSCAAFTKPFTDSMDTNLLRLDIHSHSISHFTPLSHSLRLLHIPSLTKAQPTQTASSLELELSRLNRASEILGEQREK